MRFAGPAHGTYRTRSVCSDATDAGLHGRELTLRVEPYDGPNELLRRGPLRVLHGPVLQRLAELRVAGTKGCRQTPWPCSALG